MNSQQNRLVDRFRGFYPIIIDVETGGFDCDRDALLEIAAVPVQMLASGLVQCLPAISAHVVPFPGANIDPRALEITGIDPDHPFRGALDERAALDQLFNPIRKLVKENHCQRAILVGHNAHFDLGFLNAAIKRTGHKRSPFHPFSCFDTVSLAGLAYGQTVLSKAVMASGQSWRNEDAHSAIYDAERTAELFCKIVNSWFEFNDGNGFLNRGENAKNLAASNSIARELDTSISSPLELV
jgi:ribonuclease T